MKYSRGNEGCWWDRRWLGMLWVVVLSCCGGMHAAEYYVSPQGKRDGLGTEARPWDLETALGVKSGVRPGSTIWLEAGDYRVAWRGLEVMVNGRSNAPVVIRNRAGGEVRIHGRMEVKGSYLWFWGLEFTSLPASGELDSTLRVSELQARQQAGVYAQSGINLEKASESKLINCVVHDPDEHAIIWPRGAGNSEITGCLIHSAGLMGTDGVRGLAVYGQNEDPGAQRLFRQNIVCLNLQGGPALYSAARSAIRSFRIEENILFSNGLDPQDPVNLRIGAAKDVDTIVVSSNVFWNPPGTKQANIRYDAGEPGWFYRVRFSDNWMIHGGIEFRNLKTGIEFWNNWVQGGTMLMDFKTAQDLGSANLFGNAYEGVWLRGYVDGRGLASVVSETQMDAWKGMRGVALGFENRSTLQDGPSMDVRIRLFVNPYESGRGHLVIANRRADAMVTVDVRALGWKTGQRYVIRAVQDLEGEPVHGVYQGRPVSIPMNGWGVHKPASLHYVPQSSFPEFGVFVLRAL